MTMQDETRTMCMASFRVAGATLDPAMWTGYFGIVPALAAKKGDPRTGKNGRVYSPYRVGIWSIESGIASDLVEPHVFQLIETLGLPRADLAAKLRQEGLQADIFVFWDNHSGDRIPVLATPTKEMLMDSGVEVTYDVYPQEVFVCGGGTAWV